MRLSPLDHPQGPLTALDQTQIRSGMDRARAASFVAKPDPDREARRSFRKMSLKELSVAVIEDVPLPSDMPEAEMAEVSLVEPAPEAVEPPPPVAPEEPLMAPAPAPPPEPAPPAALPEPPSPVPVGPSPEDLARLREEAYAEGFSAGKAMSESAQVAAMAQREAELAALAAGLADSALLDADLLARRIRQSVLVLASERIGHEIDSFPDLLEHRIEGLMATVRHLAGHRELFLAPADHDLLSGVLSAPDRAPDGLVLRADPALRRGEARLRVGGAEIADLMDAADD